MLLPLLRYAFAWPELDRAGLAGQLPPTDILQHAKQYEVLIDVPGVDPTHIKLELYDSCLVISGTPKAPEPAAAADEHMWLRRERQGTAAFRRMFSMPADVDFEKIKASLDKGVLKVVLPRIKAEQRPSKTIPLSKL